MKILVLTNTFPGRSESFILNQIAGLLDLGHDVRILAKRRDMTDDEARAAFPDFGRLRLAERLDHLPGAGESRSRRMRRILRGLLRSGIRHPGRLFAVIGFCLRTQDYAAAQALLLPEIIAELQPVDLLLCQFGPLGNVGILLKRFGVLPSPVATAFRGSDTTSYLRRKPRAYRYLSREGDLFLPVSSDFRGLLIGMGFPPGRIQVLYSGIDTARFRYRGFRSPDADGVLKLLSVGRMVEKKGFRYIIEALGELKRKGFRVQLTVVGDGPLLDELRRQAHALSLRREINFAGWIPHSEVVGLLEESHFLINHSVTAASGDTEGIPNVLKEAMAVGVPVVSTRHAGIPDLIEDGRTGFLVDERDTAGLVHTLETVRSGGISLPELCSAARRKVESEFDVKVVSLRLEEHLQSLLANQDS